MNNYRTGSSKLDVDLFIKKMPSAVKKLIVREAFDHRRSVNQEAIALLEEALVQRVGAAGKNRHQVQAMFERFAEMRPGAADSPDSTNVPGVPPEPRIHPSHP